MHISSKLLLKSLVYHLIQAKALTQSLSLQQQHLQLQTFLHQSLSLSNRKAAGSHHLPPHLHHQLPLLPHLLQHLFLLPSHSRLKRLCSHHQQRRSTLATKEIHTPQIILTKHTTLFSNSNSNTAKATAKETTNSIIAIATTTTRTVTLTLLQCQVISLLKLTKMQNTG